MALEELEEKEGAEKSKENSVQEGNGPKGKTMEELVEDLQKEVESLKQSKSTPQQGADLDAIKQLAEILQMNSRSSQLSENPMDYVREENLDPDDVLEPEDWITFVSHVTTFVIVDDVRKGRPVRAPFGKVEFDYDSSVVHGGKHEEQTIFNISKYVCKSKKEAEWLRAHTTFGVYFFDSIRSAKKIGSEKASKIAAFMARLNAMEQHDLVTMARENGVNAGAFSGLSELRAEIALKLAEKEGDAVQDSHYARMNESALETELLGKK